MTSKLAIATAGCGLVLAAFACGCATAPAPAPGTVSSPIPGQGPEAVKPPPATSGGATQIPAPVSAPSSATQVGTTASGGTIQQTGLSVAPRDSTPSPEAQAVLSTIPNPVPSSGDTQGVGPSTAGSAPIAAAPDTGAPAPVDSAGSAPDTIAADVPIPAPTQPLGDRPGARAVTDSLAPTGPPRTAQAAPPAGGNAGPGSAAGAALPADSCWRVQVVAVPESARAAALRDAAQSQLWTAMVIETEKKLHKVRTKECLTAAAAERLKQRAIAAGFQGAFRFKRPR